MSIKTIMHIANRNAKLAKLKVVKHAPEILIVGGCVGFTAAFVMGCKASTKIESRLEEEHYLLDKIQEKLDVYNQMVEKGEYERAQSLGYTPEDAPQDIAVIKKRMVVKMIKLYAPSVIVAGLSIAAVLKGGNLFKSRNLALAATVAALDKGYNEYRNRVRAHVGEDIEQDLFNGVVEEEVTVTETDKKTGEEKESSKKVKKPTTGSIYARNFDNTSREWKDDPKYNLMFMKGMQSHANDMLIANGHLFLNDVYDMLDIPRSKEGQIVGWYYNPNKGYSTSFVTFGLDKYFDMTERELDAICKHEFHVDFNVEGNIWERI